MTTTAQLIAVLTPEVGYHEGYKDGHWDNIEKYASAVPGEAWVSTGGEPWCAVFACWAYQTAKMPAGSYPVTASVATARDWWKNKGRFSEYPSVGAQAIFGVNGDVHTGIVIDFDATTVTTIEGNTNTNGSAEGDGVYRKVHNRTDSYVYGYGHPSVFTGGVKAAEAKYMQAGSTTTTPPAKVTTPVKPPTPKPTPKPVVDLSNLVAAARRDPKLRQGGTTHPADVKIVEQALKAEGLLGSSYASDGSFGTLSVSAYAAWQRRCGYTGSAADGIPGSASLAKLGSKHGFTVKG